MGVAGTLEYVSDLLSSVKKPKKKKQLQTVALKVRMDCEGCERKIKNLVSSMKGVKKVDVDLKQQKVTVTGYMEGKKVLEKVKATGKKAEMWPYVPYNLIAHPYVAQVYDKKAPPGFVRSVDDTSITALSEVEDRYTNIFNDENPSSCSIM
ncbi:Heavy metal-associated domain, HMA [Dillenia turbinata]|uniref:Heavy metal-associated domain, HMA n=1 Tax=Dillenia turbinata TaxID=194707 RepID=A0AAN8VYL0_9MAGN